MDNKQKINIDLHPKEYQFIQFLRTQFKFGTLEISVHNGLPQGYVIRTIEGKFDGNVEAKGP